MSQAKLSGSRVKSTPSRRGFTLVEVLVATAVTLLMMVSLAKVFKLVGDSMKQGRAALELNSRLRNVAHRIQLDLNNITVTPKPGSDALTGSGYLKIYDGPLTDYSYGMISSTFNRFGDVDDILMFTARAGDDWFVGKVPLFVLQNANLPPGNSPIAPTPANSDLVTITAQHAEIIVFAEPLVTNDTNPDRNPALLIMDPADNYSKLVGTDLPSSYRLHYRTLLIRPDLNLPSTSPQYPGELPSSFLAGSTAVNKLIAMRGAAQYPSTATAVDLPWPACDMALAHQQCDLSMRRTNQFPADPTVSSSLTANSLEDLANPANRFAHARVQLADGNFSMPVLALSPKLDMTYTAAEPGTLLTTASTVAEKASIANYQSGFLHPAFALTDVRTGEDVLASDVLAFDVKGFDPGVTLFAVTSGGDTSIVSPNDPGYGTGLASGTAVGTGDFVDIGWGRKAQVHFGASAISQLSGASSTASIPFSDSLYSSGLVLQTGVFSSTLPPPYSANLLIHQPSYDTWNSRFESDGALQSERAGQRGVVHVMPGNIGVTALAQPWRATAIDAGTDGIDNPGSGSGVDDLTELETSAPFPVDLRGMKVTIRMEDIAARTFNQMTVTKEFVTQ